MYHCKDYPWQSLATSPLAVAATVDDKEKKIANADFTITSAIARRYTYVYENVSILYYLWYVWS